MSTVTAHIRNGRIELDEPLPPDWAEGAKLHIEKAETNGIDLTGDSPEAIAAWLAWYREFRAIPRDAAAGQNLQEILNANKATAKAQFDAAAARAEGFFRE